MHNRLINCGALDGVSGWSASAGLSLTTDETQRGAPGRSVFRATGTVSAAGQSFSIHTAAAMRADVAGVSMIEASVAMAAFVTGAATTPFARLVFYDAGGALLMSIDMLVRRPVLDAWGVARDGLLDTYHRAWLRTPRPTGAFSAALEVGGVSTGSGQAVDAVLLKPLIAEAVWGAQHPLLWSPGDHTAIDLKRPSWPGVLREVQTGATFEPKAGLVEFDAGAGRPMSRPITQDPARKLNGRIRCDVVQRAVLEAFHAEARSFWMVEPGSERLCVASWAADGAPRLAETHGALHVMEFSVWLETA